MGGGYYLLCGGLRARLPLKAAHKFKDSARPRRPLTLIYTNNERSHTCSSPRGHLATDLILVQGNIFPPIVRPERTVNAVTELGVVGVHELEIFGTRRTRGAARRGRCLLSGYRRLRLEPFEFGLRRNIVASLRGTNGRATGVRHRSPPLRPRSLALRLFDGREVLGF
ncbi:hypothetical protein EVAR_21738_1 [Eumeta japonica]|uniref:Uncharacterized protein n=1 Tax=Eumeta variegata TaxID=151549 RepID=A0A4C1W7S4_EUMVA|nr:hypothetical protein EVAR_21738_1 [Eumeta japonica]